MIRRCITLSLFALVTAPTIALAQTEEVRYYHQDAVGSVRVVTDASGQIVERYDYLPFGEPWTASPTGTETRRFGGKERDAETAFDYLGARYYASQTGRFATVDPALDIQKAIMDPQRWNRYTYVLNRPLGYVDPDGLDPIPTNLLQFYNALFGANFAGVDIRTGRDASVVFSLTIGDMRGLTLGPYIFLRSDAARQFNGRTSDGIALVGHELTHVLQFAGSDFVLGSFLSPYLHDFTANLVDGQAFMRAYQNIREEIVARSIEIRISRFLVDHKELFDKLMAGQSLTDEELDIVRAELVDTLWK